MINTFVGIGKISERHAAGLAEILNTDSRLRRAVGTKADNENAASFMAYTAKWMQRTNSQTWAITFEGTAVGTISLSHRDFEKKEAQIGYWIESPKWGKKIGSTAFGLVLNHAEVNGFRMVKASIDADNPASLRIWGNNNAEIRETDSKCECSILIK